MGFLNWSSPKEYIIDGVRVVVNQTTRNDDGKITLNLMNIPSLVRGLRVRALDISQLPLCHYMKSATGRDRLPSRLDWRLTQQPNNFQNASEFYTTANIQAQIGETFIHYDAANDDQFFILPFGRVIRVEVPTMKGMVVQYHQLDDKGNSIREYAYNEVLHIHGPQNEKGEVTPLNVQFAAMLGLGSDIYSYQSNLMNRGGVKQGIITNPKPLGEDIKLGAIAAIKRLFTGRDEKGKKVANTSGTDVQIAALDNGWQWQNLNLTPQEMQMLETKKDWEKEVAHIIDLPLWKLGIIEDYKYATAEAANLDYLTSKLNPLLVQWEREVNTKVILPEERGVMYFEWNREKLIAIDSKTMAEIDDLRLKNGTINVQEARARINLNSGPEAKARYLPLNTQSAEHTAAMEAEKLKQAQYETTLKEKSTQDSNELKTTVGGSQSLTTIQIAYFAGQLSREAAMASAKLVFGFTPEEAGTLFPIKPATDPTPPTVPDKKETTPPAPVPEKPTGEPAAGAVGMNGEELAAMQAEMVASQGPDASLETSLRAWADVATQRISKAYGLDPNHFASLTEKYLASAIQRSDTSRDYEANRLLNALHHHAIGQARGVKAQVKWVGGALNGQMKAVSETWEGKCKHPPINKEECGCFLVPV